VKILIAEGSMKKCNTYAAYINSLIPGTVIDGRRSLEGVLNAIRETINTINTYDLILLDKYLSDHESSQDITTHYEYGSFVYKYIFNIRYPAKIVWIAEDTQSSKKVQFEEIKSIINGGTTMDTTNKTIGATDLDKDIPEYYKNLFNSFKSTSPVAKLNIETTDPKFVLGLYLMTKTSDEIREILKPKAVMDDLNEDTLLFFEARHVMELITVINGMLTPAVTAGVIPFDTVKIKTNKLIEVLNVPTYYDTFKAFLHKFCHRLNLLNSFPQDYVDRISAVFDYIWFVPYVSMDEIVNSAVKQYEQETGDIVEDKLNG
jgi:hypothetical protein